MDALYIEVIKKYVEKLDMVNLFRKRKYSQPILLRKVKIKPVCNRLSLIISNGIQDNLDDIINEFKKTCASTPDRIQDYNKILDYVRMNNSTLFGITSDDLYIVDENYKEISTDCLSELVDVAGDIILDLRYSGAVKILFLVRAIRESL
jgi:hypothetical protein